MRTYIGDQTDNTFSAGNSNESWQIIGNGGHDILSGGRKADIIYGNEGLDRLYGYGGNDQLIGGSGQDELYGGTGNDRMGGGDDHDYLSGDEGNDTMVGGLGNDVYIVDSPLDRTVEASGEGIDSVRTSLSVYALERGNEVEILHFYESAGAAVGVGNQFNNIIVGNAFNNRLFGVEGNDGLYSAGGDDFLDGGIGADTLYGGTGNDRYVVDNASDLILERANEGSYDRVDASVSYSIENAGEVEQLFLEEGTAAINGTGNSFDNFLVGNSANNTLSGLRGNDHLLGEGGNDILVGTVGGVNLNDEDILDGGAGADTFVLGTSSATFYEGEGFGLVADFNIQEGDRIQLKGPLNSYQLRQESRTGVGTEAQDTSIWRGSDLIGVIQDRTITTINTQNGFVSV